MLDGYAIHLLLPEKVEGVWPSLEKWVAKYLAESLGEYILTDIKQLLTSGEWQCWVIQKNGKLCGIALSTIVTFPRLKTLQIPAVAGEKLQEWVHLVSEIEDFAKLNGCTVVGGQGRLGWERVLVGHGYTKKYSVVVKAL